VNDKGEIEKYQLTFSFLTMIKNEIVLSDLKCKILESKDTVVIQLYHWYNINYYCHNKILFQHELTAYSCFVEVTR